MNHYSVSILREFLSARNIYSICDRLVAYFNDIKINDYIDDFFDDNIRNYASYIEKELLVSDPILTIPMYDQVNYFNNEFIKSEIHLIQSHVLINDQQPLCYGLGDNARITRSCGKRPANDMLSMWRINAGKGIELRDDMSGDIYGPSTPSAPCTPSHRDHPSTGVMICDQRHMGTQNHVEQYENTTYKKLLNSQITAYESTPFGVSTTESDERLLSRNIFRKNERGRENEIPMYERRLYNRYLERDISEGLRNAEKNYISRGYDMSSIYRRLNYKHAGAQNNAYDTINLATPNAYN
jgi:hypothetical protein